MSAEPEPLRPGDRVRINARVIGTVQRIVDGHAHVVERETFGRPVTWSILCDAAIRVPPSDDLPGDWQDRDFAASYDLAIQEVGARVKAGEPVPNFMLGKR